MTIIWCMVPEKWSTTDKIFCHSGPSFALLPPLINWKIKILKKWKNHLETLSFYSGPIFPFFAPPNSPKNPIFLKWKKHLEISSLYICVPKTMIKWFTVPEIWCATDRWTDRRTNEWTEKVTYRGRCPS